MGISQEKLAELSKMSVQMINSIEGCRVWVSDKTLIKLSSVLRVETYQLFTPAIEESTKNKDVLVSNLLRRLKHDIRSDINADIDVHFTRLIKPDVPD